MLTIIKSLLIQTRYTPIHTDLKPYPFLPHPRSAELGNLLGFSGFEYSEASKETVIPSLQEQDTYPI